MQLANRMLKRSYPNFKYTSVQYNKNYESKMHVDGNQENI